MNFLMMKNCLIREMQFRVNFLIRTFTEILWLGMQLIYVTVLYSSTQEIGGWNKWEMIILLGTNHFITQIFEALFFDNCTRLVDQIRQGDLDFVLIKPVNSQFLVSLRYTDYASIINSSVGLLMIGFALHQMGAAVTLPGLLLFAGLVINSVLILYTMMFCLSAMTFWMGRSSNLFELYWQLGQFGRYPGEIYGEIYRFGLRLLLLTAIPMLVVTNFPATVLFRGLGAGWLVFGFALGLTFFCLTILVWNKGLGRYRSASS
jgi:ABC-2 type transport system permease protein